MLYLCFFPLNLIYLLINIISICNFFPSIYLISGKRFYAHRICLLASSDAFRAMFDGGYRVSIYSCNILKCAVPWLQYPVINSSTRSLSLCSLFTFFLWWTTIPEKKGPNSYVVYWYMCACMHWSPSRKRWMSIY